VRVRRGKRAPEEEAVEDAAEGCNRLAVKTQSYGEEVKERQRQAVVHRLAMRRFLLIEGERRDGPGASRRGMKAGWGSCSGKSSRKGGKCRYLTIGVSS